jgi:O-antigen/teichoic acid export membrane protein
MNAHWQQPNTTMATPPVAPPQRERSRRLKAALAAATRLISFGYLVLRATTAAGALVAGLVQTFVFARVLSPEQFSIFVLLASFGVSMALLDFGVVKLLFVRLRAAWLGNRINAGIAGQATAVVALYTLLCMICVAACVAVLAALPAVSATNALHYSLFFLFAALNFIWAPLRNISVAIDEFIFFESLEAARRIGNIVLTLAMLLGFPLLAFLIAINVLWAVLLSISIRRLVRYRVMTLDTAAILPSLRMFYVENRRGLIGSGTYATTEIFVYSFPYVVVSAFFGLGAPTIILDTTLKIFRGASLIYAAACDLFVPRQTKAFANRDRSTMVRATWLAALFCGVPAAVLCGILIVSANKIFGLLLGPAATMPAEVAPILVVLLIANLTQMVSHSLLVHSGFFKEVGKLGTIIAVAMTATTAFALWVGIDIIGFLKIYTGVYSCGALISVVLVLRGPVRSVTN